MRVPLHADRAAAGKEQYESYAAFYQTPGQQTSSAEFGRLSFIQSVTPLRLVALLAQVHGFGRVLLPPKGELVRRDARGHLRVIFAALAYGHFIHPPHEIEHPSLLIAADLFRRSQMQ